MKLLDRFTKKEGGVAFVLLYTAAMLTVLEYRYLPTVIEARLRGLPSGVRPAPSLEAGVTWAIACVAGYLVLPLLWMLAVHRRPPAEIGFSGRGFRRHAGVYLGLYVLMLPVLWHVAKEPSFRDTYPFVRESLRDLGTFLRWELAYVAQFLALEAFFRGYLLFRLEKFLGPAAIYVMTVPYCMIHYHKPLPEALGAIVAGVVLGHLALKFRSWYGGALLHILVAVTMDGLAARRAGLF